MLPILLAFAIILPTPAFLLLIMHYPGNGKPFQLALVFAVIMSGLAFGLYNTVASSDLTRYMNEAMLTVGKTFQESLRVFEHSHMSDTPAAVFWFWLVGKTGNPQWYPASIGFVEFFALGYIATDFCLDHNYSRARYAFVLIILMLTVPFFDSITSVRSTPAIAMGILAVYLEYYKHQYIVFACALYVVALLLHPGAFFVLLVRLACKVSERSLKAAIILTVLSLPTIYVLSNALTPILQTLGIKSANRLWSYIANDDSEYALHIMGNNTERAKRSIAIALSVTTIILLSKYDVIRRRANGQALGIDVLACMLAGVLISFAGMVSIPSYARFLYTMVPLSAVSNYHALNDECFDKQSRRGLYAISLFLYVIFLVMYAVLMFYSMRSRVSLQGFFWHMLFGFFAPQIVG